MITITSDQILYVCGFVGAVWGLWKIVKEWKKPNDDLKAMVEEHEEVLKRDHERLKSIEESDKMMLQCLLVIINHDITGNGISNLVDVRDELQEFLINK